MRITRRGFLGWTGAVAATAAGCQGIRALGDIQAATYQAEMLPQGIEGWVASVCQQCPGGCGILVRTITDAAWMASPRARDWRMGIRAIYYGILVAFSIWGVFMIRSASPFQLFKILANMAGIVLLIAGVQIFLVNRRFLPKALQPAWWQEAGLLACSAFYAFFAYFVVRDLLRSFGVFG